MKQLTVHTAAPYEVLVGRGIASTIGARVRALFPGARVFVVADENVAALHGGALLSSLKSAGAEAALFALPAGEAHKNHETLLALYGELAKNGATRKDVLLAFGGGVTGDIAGFAAATYMRGMPCVMLPTSLLAMADSSIGGKTAVNLPCGKNLVGAFSQPRLVLCDTAYLSTLPKREYRAGLAEIVKCAAIRDQRSFALLENGGMSDEEMLFFALNVKRALVESDERDAGERRLLNFGHTVGHAAEQASGFSLLHGEAVSIGMVWMARVGVCLGVTEKGTAARLGALLAKLGLPVEYEGDERTLKENLKYDKKTEGERIDAVLLQKIGAAARCPLTAEELFS